VTRVLALDCEMVGTGPDGSRSALARVVVVNAVGNVVLDSFVRPASAVTNYRTAVSGIRPHQLQARIIMRGSAL
jgi:RNA exonuclease 4